MPAPLNLSGQRFGRLTVIEPSGTRRRSFREWRCACDCGREHVAAGPLLKDGRIKSCGCWKVDAPKLRRTHGHTSNYQKHPLYSIWQGMRKRCLRESEPRYKDYGGRGITICVRWDDFGAFVEDMFPTWSPGLSIERKDNDGPYSPDNCVWADFDTQANNKRNNVILETPIGPMTYTQAAALTGLSRDTLRYRFESGWPQDLIFEVWGVRGHVHRAA